MKCNNCNENIEGSNYFELKEPIESCSHCHSDLYEENVFCGIVCLIDYLNKKLPIGSPPFIPEDISDKEMLKEEE